MPVFVLSKLTTKKQHGKYQVSATTKQDLSNLGDVKVPFNDLGSTALADPFDVGATTVVDSVL
jgi:hypothetical protein